MAQKAEKKSYYELLKHPKWQRKRLEILQRASFECEDCGSTEATLNVHHSYYEKGLAPWEYPDESLHCVCDDCHKRQQDILTLLQRQIGRLSEADHYDLLGYALGLEAFTDPMVIIEVTSYEIAMGVGRVWNLTPEQVINALRDYQIDGHTLEKLSRAARDRQSRQKSLKK